MNPSKLRFRERCRGALHRAAIVALASALALVQSAQACTSFLLRTSDGGVVYGRTMEFGFQLTSEAIVLPRQFAFSATGPGGKPGLVWTSKYGAVGLNAFGLPVLTDGMNEKGLAGGILYFPGYAGYANPVATDPAKALAPWEFLTWALTSFAVSGRGEGGARRRGHHRRRAAESRHHAAVPLHAARCRRRVDRDRAGQRHAQGL